MKVKAIVNIDDLQDKVFRPVESIFEVSEERAEYLLKNKAIVIVDTKEESENIIPLDKENIKKVGNELLKHIDIKPKKKKSNKK